MKLSVVTPCYNAARWLPDCAQSVRHAGTGIEYEHWVIDGGSTDGTQDFLRAQTDLRWLSESDSGMYDALNKGIALASGEVIGHLNADEQYNRAGLQAALKMFADRPDLDAVFSPTVMVDADGKFLQLFKQNVTPTVADTHWCMPVQSCSLLYRRACWRLLAYDTHYRIVADHVWFRQQMERGLRLAPVQEPIGIFTWRPDNLSNTAANEDGRPPLAQRARGLKWAKYRYRWRKFLAGGYRRDPVRYEIWRKGHLQVEQIARPALKLPLQQLRGSKA